MGPFQSKEIRRRQRELRAEMSSPQSATSSSAYPYSPTPPVTARVGSITAQELEDPPDAAAATAIDTPTLTAALNYISNRLLQKTKAHHTFIVTGDIIFSLFFRCKNITRSVELIQTSMLTYKQKDQLISAVLRASEKYGIVRDDWINNGGEVSLEKEYMDEVVARSLKQKEIVFSGDGMTLLAVDFFYELRMMLHRFSKELEEDNREEGNEADPRRDEKSVDVDNMVELVRRLVAVEGKGKSLRKAAVEERYGKLGFSDYAWMILSEEYERRFGEKGLGAEDESDDEDGIIMASTSRDADRDRDSIWTDAS